MAKDADTRRLEYERANKDEIVRQTENSSDRSERQESERQREESRGISREIDDRSKK